MSAGHDALIGEHAAQHEVHPSANAAAANDLSFKILKCLDRRVGHQKIRRSSVSRDNDSWRALRGRRNPRCCRVGDQINLARKKRAHNDTARADLNHF